MEENDNKLKVELRSPSVQEILGRPPKWIIRWGITVIFIVIVGLFIGSYFYKYPDIVTATIEVTTENLPAQLVAKATGKLDTIFVRDNQSVESDMYLAVIENTADFNDILKLKNKLEKFEIFFRSPFNSNVKFEIDNSIRAGELQNSYYQFVKSWEDYEYFIKADYHNHKINALKRQIKLQERLSERMEKQCRISKEQMLAQERLFDIDSNLYVRKTLSLVEYENAKNAFLQVQNSYESTLTSLDNIQITIAQHEQSIFDLQQEAEERKKELLLILSGNYENLINEINLWEMKYVFQSPISGKVALSKQWQKNQHVNMGDIFLNVVPEETTHITGKILLPSHGSGKVKKGQYVNIKFDGYPYMEFGMVRGVIKNISLVPVKVDKDKFTMIEVEFPDNLTTNYKKELEFSQEMSGTADIITEDMRLIQRFLNPIKSLLTK